MQFPLLAELCESHLIPSKTSLKSWKEPALRELAYLYFLALRVLATTSATKSWAESYIAKAVHANDFETWRTDGNDFYVLLHALIADDQFKESKPGVSTNAVRDWMRHAAKKDFAANSQRLFNRLDAMFHITASDLKTMRRRIAHWDDADAREQEDVLVKLIQKIKKLAPKSELLTHLNTITSTDDAVHESASAGATGAASVATAVGGLGAGFDPNGDRGVYEPANKKKTVSKPVIVRR